MWDGKDDAGAVLPEGGYKGALSVFYVNGHKPSAESPAVTIKLTAPTAAAKAEFDVFSPTGDSPRHSVAIYQDTSSELFWTGTFKDRDSKDVKTLVWRGRADDKFEWDGRGDDGRVLPDGLYSYTLSATDQAGNTGASKPIALRIDTEKKPVRISTDLVYFSPFGSGTKTTGSDHSLPRGDDRRGFLDHPGPRVRTAASCAPTPAAQRRPTKCSGTGSTTTARGSPTASTPPPSRCRTRMGASRRRRRRPFFVDNHVPKVDVSADAMLFSPTADSKLPGGDDQAVVQHGRPVGRGDEILDGSEGARLVLERERGGRSRGTARTTTAT